MAGTIEIPAFGCDEDDPSVVLARLRDYMQANHASLLDDCNFDDLEETGGAAAAEGEIESDFLFRTEYPVQELKRTEEKILRYAEINDVVVEGSDIKIHTAKFNVEEETDADVGDKVPVVMIHGLGGCILAFHKNYSVLAEDRDVYGIDMPGFGLSSRKVKFPCTIGKFPKDPKKALELVRKSEKRMVELIEKWRQKMNLEEMILVGHSFGGYVSARYTLTHPNRVRHLVMVDPWGVFTEQEVKEIDSTRVAWKRNSVLEGLAMRLSKPCRLRPLDISRAGGNVIGVLIMKVMVPESQQEAYGDETMKYFVDVNMGKPTGEKLFSVLSGYDYVFPMTSLMTTLQELPKRPPITFIYGALSSFRNPGVDKLRDLPGVTVEEVDGAAHHVHAENEEKFHDIMREVFRKADQPKT